MFFAILDGAVTAADRTHRSQIHDNQRCKYIAAGPFFSAKGSFLDCFAKKGKLQVWPRSDFIGARCATTK